MLVEHRAAYRVTLGGCVVRREKRTGGRWRVRETEAKGEMTTSGRLWEDSENLKEGQGWISAHWVC